ncbi:MAG TPA: Crp/Fnr family transcriptional regulator [Bacillota bacterium]|mgnify:FL=1|nr:Crp/Fnr family transcriptional regulator [Bacillota bacterium]HOK68938.1 Crp/Fnr family transcriptional regulator [Bacillota bacterium]HPP85276.1 Crp/Fnr family transcriptional regulator [Bacillota bacterium]
MENISKILKNTGLFAGIEEENIDRLLGCLSARAAEFKKDVYIMSMGEKPSDVGIVLSGSVNIISEDYWGNRTIIAKATAGELFAEAFSCADVKKLPVSVVSAEKTSVLLIDYKKIITTCTSACVFHTSLIRNMLQILANKSIYLMKKIEHTARRTTREKLLSYLSDQAIAAESSSFDIPFNRQELADYLCVDRSAMSNELSKLRDEGILEFKKNHFVLK